MSWTDFSPQTFELCLNPCCPRSTVSFLCFVPGPEQRPGRDWKRCVCVCVCVCECVDVYVCVSACVCVFVSVRTTVRCEMKSEAHIVYHACISIWLLELYVDTDIPVTLCVFHVSVVSSRLPQSVFSGEPSRGAHRSWGRGQAWLTGRSERRCAAWGEGTCRRFPEEEIKATWAGRCRLQMLDVQEQPLILSLVASSGS